MNSFNRISQLDRERHRITFARPAGVFFLGPEVRYYVEGVREALDAPGEWHLDAERGVLNDIGGIYTLLIYILIEHQSEPDRLMPLRSVDYVVQIFAEATLRPREVAQKLRGPVEISVDRLRDSLAKPTRGRRNTRPSFRLSR